MQKEKIVEEMEWLLRLFKELQSDKDKIMIEIEENQIKIEEINNQFQNEKDRNQIQKQRIQFLEKSLS